MTCAVAHVSFFVKHVLDRKNSIQKAVKKHIKAGK